MHAQLARPEPHGEARDDRGQQDTRARGRQDIKPELSGLGLGIYRRHGRDALDESVQVRHGQLRRSDGVQAALNCGKPQSRMNPVRITQGIQA